MTQQTITLAPAAKVSIAQVTSAQYPTIPPFDPDSNYPELSQLQSRRVGRETNQVYAAVRQSLLALGLDGEKVGTQSWNPFRGIVNPGDRVVVKPNWVFQGHHSEDSWQQIVTHGAVLRAVLDYVAIALEGRGQLALIDGPMLSADFSLIEQRLGLKEIARHINTAAPRVHFELVDLRALFLETRDDVIVRRAPLPGDPRGAVSVDLGERSELFGFRGEGRYYGADYDTKEVNRHHCGRIHEYLLSRTALQADVIIDVPKLKTHQKVGVTLCLKGVVGLNCGRNWLPHRTQGTPSEGGDQFRDSSAKQRLEAAVVRALELGTLQYPWALSPAYRLAKRLGKRIFGTTDQVVRGGGWHGNDTLWRTVLDINRALTFSDPGGQIHETKQRRRFCIVDGVIGGEGSGPLYATPVPVGCILAGSDAVAVDAIATELIGFDHRRVPMIRQAFADHPLGLSSCSPSDVTIVGVSWGSSLDALRARTPFCFREPNGWIGKLRRQSDEREGRS